MRTSVICIVVALALSGCGKKAASSEPTATPTPAPTPAPEPTLADEPAPTPEPEPAPAPTPEPAPAPEPAPTPDAPGDPAPDGDTVFAAADRMPAGDCETIVTKEFALVAESGSDESKAAAAKLGHDAALANCTARPYPKAAADCIRGASTADEMMRSCYTLPFQGRDLVIKREFTANDPANQTADPPMFTQHGDIIIIHEGCGLLLQKLEEFTAAFLLCDGKTQGPFTSNADIKEVFAAMSAEQEAAHKMMMGIMANYPSGRFGGNWRVCNAAGVCHTE